MSEAPRTEAVVKMAVGPMREYAIIKHAQTLERELLKAQRERDEARDQSRWKSSEVALPTEGDWVLHTYKGVRAPEYGIYERGHFFRGGGPEGFPATHWLRVPYIDEEDAK